MEVEYGCPKCQSQLRSWEEYVYDKERLINKKTGVPNKTIKKSRPIPLDTYGLSCTNDNCGFIYYANGSNEKDFDHLDQIISRIV